MNTFFSSFKAKILLLLACSLIAWIPPAIVAHGDSKDSATCGFSGTLQGYVCNWLDYPVEVTILASDSIDWKGKKPSTIVFGLPAKDAIGKPDQYKGTVVPNCKELKLPCGPYHVFVVDPKTRKLLVSGELPICKEMRIPWEVDIE